jgi:PAS domain S-box-containing protein
MSSSPDNRIQVLYEIALSIEPAADVETTLDSALGTYLQKLGCSGGAAFEAQHRPTDGRAADYSLVTRTPVNSSLVDRAVEGARDRLADDATLVERCPVVDEFASDTYRYLMRLPEFGALVLVRRGTPLPSGVLQSLPRLNSKLATACNRVAIQRQYETQYRELFERAPVMFALTRRTDGEAVITDCNRRFAETLGYDVAALRGHRLAALYTDESRAAMEDGYDRALAGEFTVEEREFRTRLGGRKTTLLRATPRRDRTGEVVGTNSLYVDVTELQRRNQQLSVLNRILRHNLRNDLTVVNAQVKRALDRAESGAVVEALSTAAARTESLLSTADVADRVRHALNRQTVAPQSLDDAAGRVVDRAREEFPAADVVADLGPATATATESLDAALWELVENACDHAGPSSHVVVTTRCEGDEATVTVADDGPGIPAAEHRILTDGVETQLEHGSGLGLWLVYWVVEASGGDVDFEVDDGTEVTVRLQAAPDG